MNASIASTNPITDGQKDTIVRITADAARKAIKTLNLTIPGSQRVMMRRGKLQNAIINNLRELSLEPPKLDCFAASDWEASYRISLTPEQVATIGNFPWSEAVLNAPCPFHKGKMVRETHFAFVGLESITLMELQKLSPKSAEPRFYSYGPGAWYAEEKFAITETLKLRWYLRLKGIVPGSESRMFDEQQAMLPREYEVPSAVEETATDLLLYKKTSAYVNPSRYVYSRTASVASDGHRVYVGAHGALGVDVCSRCAGSYYYIGVGASRKFEEALAA